MASSSPPSHDRAAHPQPPASSTAWPLAAAWLALIVYASLFPFRGWHESGVACWDFLTAPLPHYWTWFDIIGNVLAYLPLGFLLTLGLLRDGQGPWRRWSVPLVLGAAILLSLLMESVQCWLPNRIQSNLDTLLNASGALIGALAARGIDRLGAVGRWSALRARWFTPDARGALVLLVLWPCALLYPLEVPFGLGQVLERVELWLAGWLTGTPFLEWLPLRAIEFQPMLPGVELMVMVLGLWIPALLAYAIIPSRRLRAVALISCLLAGLGATLLSQQLAFGPELAADLSPTLLERAIPMAFVLGLLSLWLPRRVLWLLALLALIAQLHVVNDAAVSVYYRWAVENWMQRRFIRLYGLTQWLGWAWPYAALAYVMIRLVQRPAPIPAGTAVHGA